MLSSRASLLLPLLFATGCNLLTTQLSGTVQVDFDVDTTDKHYADDFVVDANDNQDVRDNREHIQSGAIKDVRFEIVSLHDGNAATVGTAELYARRFEASTWPEEPRERAISTVDAQPVVPGPVALVLSEEKKQEIADLLFAESGETRVELRFAGDADNAPVRFTGRAIFELDVTAGL